MELLIPSNLSQMLWHIEEQMLSHFCTHSEVYFLTASPIAFFLLFTDIAIPHMPTPARKTTPAVIIGCRIYTGAQHLFLIKNLLVGFIYFNRKRERYTQKQKTASAKNRRKNKKSTSYCLSTLELLPRVELGTSSLPRMRSTN